MPAREAQRIQAYAGAANLMTTILGIYFALFISLPVTVKVYELVTGDKRSKNAPVEAVQEENVVADAVPKAAEKQSFGDMMRDTIIILVLTGIFCTVGNCVGFGGTLADSAISSIVFVVLSLIGVLLAHSPSSCRFPDSPAKPGLPRRRASSAYWLRRRRSWPMPACRWARIFRPLSACPGVSFP